MSQLPKRLEPEERLALLVDQAVATAIERAGVNPVNLTINITINQVNGGGAHMNVTERR